MTAVDLAYRQGFQKAARIRPLMAAGRFVSRHPRLFGGARPALREAAYWGASGAAGDKVTEWEYGGANPFMDKAEVQDKEKYLAKVMNTLAFRYTPRALLNPGMTPGLRANLGRFGVGVTAIGSTPAIRGIQVGREAGKGLIEGQKSITGTLGRLENIANRADTLVDNVSTTIEGGAETIAKDLTSASGTIDKTVTDVADPLKTTATSVAETADSVKGTTARAEKLLEAMEAAGKGTSANIAKLTEALGALGKPRDVENQISGLLSRMNSGIDSIKALPWRNIGYGAAGVGGVYGLGKVLNAMRNRKKRMVPRGADRSKLTSAQRKQLALELAAYEQGQQKATAML